MVVGSAVPTEDFVVVVPIEDFVEPKQVEDCLVGLGNSVGMTEEGTVVLEVGPIVGSAVPTEDFVAVVGPNQALEAEAESYFPIAHLVCFAS